MISSEQEVGSNPNITNNTLSPEKHDYLDGAGDFLGPL